MSQTAPDQSVSPAKLDWRQGLQSWMEQSQRIVLKWLYDVGGWIFTGLIAVALMILQNLIAIGSADRALLVAGLLLAAALPLNLAGLWIVRYLKNLDQAGEEIQNTAGDVTVISVPPVGFTATSPEKRKFTNTILSALLALSVLLTLLGICLALWHISWAATIIFIIAALAGLLTTLWVLAYRG